MSLVRATTAMTTTDDDDDDGRQTTTPAMVRPQRLLGQAAGEQRGAGPGPKAAAKHCNTNQVTLRMQTIALASRGQLRIKRHSS